MSQNYTENCFAVSNPGLTDLQNMENNFHCLKTLFSGSSAPSDSTGGMPWFDTANKILKIRNSTNGAWKGVHYSGSGSRWWVYNNAAEDGWIVDSSITDRVVAVAGGSNAYNVAGGSAAGTWTISGLSGAAGSHYHQWLQSNSSVVSYQYSWNSTGGSTYFTDGVSKTGPTTAARYILFSTDSINHYTAQFGYYTDSGTTHAVTISSTNTWRPAAAVGTLQYLSL